MAEALINIVHRVRLFALVFPILKKTSLGFLASEIEVYYPYSTALNDFFHRVRGASNTSFHFKVCVMRECFISNDTT